MSTQGPSPSDEQELDDILDNIDKLIDHQCKKVTDQQEATPQIDRKTQVFSAAHYKKTRASFQQLSEEDAKALLGESSDELPALNNKKPASPPRRSIWPWKRSATG